MGGARYGMVDRTAETVSFRPVAHPIGNGVGEFLLMDEFYPTMRFQENDKRVTPILTGMLHPQYRDGKFLVANKAETHPVAWAFERDDGGRAFTFTGLHYLADLDNAALRKLLLNAILWTAKIEVPKEGVRTDAPADAAEKLISQELALASGPPKTVEEAIVRHPGEYQVIDYPWGHLTWYVSRELKNSDTMTTGEVVIKPDQENARHFHPNCDEVLHVLRGSILQSMGDNKVEMHEGDTVSLRLTDGPYKDRTLSVVFTATNAGFVYAINASAHRDVSVGTILWKRQLAPPCIHGFIATSDGIPAGVMSTPVIDPKTLRLYVTSCTSRKAADSTHANEFGDQFDQAYALDATSGRLLPGWPVSLDRVTLNSPGVNRNAADGGQQPVRPEMVPGTKDDFGVGHSDVNLGMQRGALNLSPDGSLLYATFGESIPGWVVAVNTSTAKVASAFASVSVPHGTAGGIWGPGGAAIDMQGNVFVIVGTAFGGYVDQPHDWVQSALMFPQPVRRARCERCRSACPKF